MYRDDERPLHVAVDKASTHHCVEARESAIRNRAWPEIVCERPRCSSLCPCIHSSRPALPRLHQNNRRCETQQQQRGEGGEPMIERLVLLSSARFLGSTLRPSDSHLATSFSRLSLPPFFFLRLLGAEERADSITR